MLLSGVLVGTTAGVAHLIGLRINLTGSIPAGIYRIEKGPLNRGDIVLACLSAHAASFARDREYVPSGSCPDGSAPIGKPIVALAGDTVHVDSVGVRVNGRLLRHSGQYPRDSRGRPLSGVKHGVYVVEDGHAWLISAFSGTSFDSRYFGPVPTSQIVAKVRPILTQ